MQIGRDCQLFQFVEKPASERRSARYRYERVFGSIIVAGKPLSRQPLSEAVELKGKTMLAAGMATAVIGMVR
jgi:hypothetical protein